MKAMLLLFMISFGAYAQVKTYGSYDLNSDSQIELEIFKVEGTNQISGVGLIKLDGKDILIGYETLPKSLKNAIKRDAENAGILSDSGKRSWSVRFKNSDLIQKLAKVHVTNSGSFSQERFGDKIIVNTLIDPSATITTCPANIMGCANQIYLSVTGKKYLLDTKSLTENNLQELKKLNSSNNRSVSVEGYIRQENGHYPNPTATFNVFKIISIKFLDKAEGNLEQDVRVVNLSRNDSEVKEVREINLSPEGQIRRSRQPAIVFPTDNPNVINN